MDRSHSAYYDDGGDRRSEIHRNSSSAGYRWEITDPDYKRRKRIAKYKAYTVEGNVKASFRLGFRWIRKRFSQIIHGEF